MDERSRALEQIVTIARAHGLSGLEIGAALGEAAREAPASTYERRRTVLVRALGYLGGTFVFAGIGVFIALQWEGMNAAARVVITLGSGLAACALAVLACREARFDKAAPPLFLIAAALEPTGMLVAFDEFGSGGDWRLAAIVTCVTMTLQFGGVFAAVRRGTPLFMAVAFAMLFWWTTFDLLDADKALVGLVIGSSLLLTAIGVDRTPYSALTPSWYLVGGAAFLYGLFDGLEHTPLEILFLVAACGFVYLSVQVHSRTLLVVATAAILAYTAWFTGERFANSIGWPLALVVFGLIMIGLSTLAFRIDRDYVRKPDSVGRT
ncbi:MAG TPA: DUF2157 domain-containing protein [Vicinamibacterales bacterium]|nr:DUF2157 domain-containing protein [Vicinamibacterales bacterium]